MSRLGKILFLFSGLSLVCFALVRFLTGAWVPFLWIALGLFAGFLVGGFYVDRSFFKEFLGMKTTKQGMSMGATIALVLVLLTAINFIGARRYLTWDLSLNKVNTLSDQSVKLVKDLKEDLKVIYFYKNGTEGVDQNRRGFIDLIRKYQDQSPLVKLEFVEVNERPDLTEKYKITKGTQAVLLEYKGRTNLIEKIDEQELTSALVKVTREKDKKVYLLSGHGELATEPSQDGQSVSLMKQLLEGNRYTVQTFSLTTAPAVPEDADVLIIPGPQQGFIDVEIKAIENYLKRGGSVILALKPKAPHRLDGLLAQFGIKLNNDVVATVLDTPMGRAVDPRFTRGSLFSSQSKITSPFGRSEFTVFHLPQSLKHETAPVSVTVDDLVRTNDSAMSFSDLTFQKGGVKGPFTLGVEIKGTWPGEKDAKPFELVVFGDSDFLNDQYLYQNLNRDLLLNSVSALAKEENLISVTPKEIQATKMELTDTQFILFIFAFVIPLPVLLFVASGVLWFRRRHA
jgi:ABC-type uncharacterized transport system involved in gliding motility auxiliary subunit